MATALASLDQLKADGLLSEAARLHADVYVTYTVDSTVRFLVDDDALLEIRRIHLIGQGEAIVVTSLETATSFGHPFRINVDDPTFVVIDQNKGN